LICIALVACGQASQVEPTSTPLPTNTAIPSQTATPQLEATLTVDIYALPTFSFVNTPVAGVNIPSPTPNPKIPTLIPTIDPNLISDLLKKSVSIQTLTGVDGHDLQRITGWKYGFRQRPCYPYQWLDSSYLILYPRIGESLNVYHDGGGLEDLGSEPIILNHTNGTFWLRPLSSVAPTIIPDQDCNSVYWSQKLGLIINQQNYGSTFGPSKNAVFTYTFDGQSVAHYWGTILGVSPSGEKILVDEDTLIDLHQNKTIDLGWHMNYDVGDSPTLYWSSDENRLYKCCFYYADFKSGQSFNFQWTDLHGVDGKPLTLPMHPHKYGEWVRNDNYFLIEWDYWTILYGDPIPLFSPAEKNYYDIREIAGIPPSVVSTSISQVSPNGQYLWLKGFGDDGQYHGFLVNLVDFKTVLYDKPINDFEWSPDSKYAWMTIFDSNGDPGGIYILSAAKTTLTLFPTGPTTIPAWRPSDHISAYLTKQNQTLDIMDAQDMSVRERGLPSTFNDLIWSPDGNHLAMVAADGSLWQVDYPQMKNFEQLTQPMPAKNIQWSPDGKSITFISGPDIYIVQANK
jgi:WD40 repeat protein